MSITENKTPPLSDEKPKETAPALALAPPLPTNLPVELRVLCMFSSSSDSCLRMHAGHSWISSGWIGPQLHLPTDYVALWNNLERAQEFGVCFSPSYLHEAYAFAHGATDSDDQEQDKLDTVASYSLEPFNIPR